MTSSAKPASQAARSTPAPAPASRGYANYVLFVLTLVYVFNFIDRQILSILAEDIKRDLGLADAADRLPLRHRVRRLLRHLRHSARPTRRHLGAQEPDLGRPLLLEPDDRAVGHRAQVRHARRLPHRRRRRRVERQPGRVLDARRLLPAAPARDRGRDLLERRLHRRRASASSSAGSSSATGTSRYAAGGAPFGLAGWQAAFFAVGLPGLLMALWVRTLREPVRGAERGAGGAADPSASVPRALPRARSRCCRRSRCGRWPRTAPARAGS